MTEKPTLRRVTPKELSDVLARLADEQVSDIAIIGPDVQFFALPDRTILRFTKRVVYQLTEKLPELTPQLLGLDRLRSLLLWSLDLRAEDARVIAKHFRQLTSINLSGNAVGDAGARAVAEQLVQVTSLSLRGNSVGDAGARAIAEHLGQLTSLDLGFNKVGKAGVRAIAEHLGQLNSLDLSYNKMGEAGARAIAQRLDQLTSLDLRRNEMGDAAVWAIAEQLGQLTLLDLSYNKVGDGGASAIARHLGQLTLLNLRRNQVGDAGVRAIAEHLGQLTSLDLSYNEVRDTSALAIAEHLGQLTSLNLSRNNIGEAGARAIAERLNRLTSLDFHANQVNDDTVAAIGRHLSHLVKLNLSSNDRITAIAPLANLPALTTLALADTSVADLSPLKSLVLRGLPVKWADQSWEGPGIYVKSCPLTYPCPEVVTQGPEAVLNFFREIEEQGEDRLYEAKLLILGEGGVGKTSLVRRLYQPDCELPSEDQTTRGIDIHCHEFRGSGGQPFRVNVWDFGGQQIYHATHQFFLTKSSLYVLVDNTRTDHRSIHDEGFKYWLEVVETLSECSPVLIFQNEVGGRSKQIDIAGIKGRFPNVQETFRGNLEHPAAADGLRQAVEYHTQRLPHVGKAVPAGWVDVRRGIEELACTRPHISQEEYFEIYSRHLKLDRTKALHLSQYLHDLGVCLHFQQSRELRRTVFLRNQWVTDAVFRILDDEQVKAARGRFTLADCDRLWSDHGYQEKDEELRALMVRFELCYPLADVTAQTWLAPQLLSPSKPPELDDWAATGDLMLTYRYEFLPKGLVSRLIVRMHRFVRQPDLCWANGAVFDHDDTQVLVELTQWGNEIALRRGAKCKELLSVIASDLDALNDSFQGLKGKVGKWVPCVCPTCAGLGEPAMFEEKKLIERKRQGKPTIECPQPPDYTDVSVLELLDGMNLERWLELAKKELTSTDPLEPTDTPMEKTIRIFLASSAELREDRDAFDLYFRQQNDRLRKQGLYLEIVRWENFLDAMSSTRLQDEYNQQVRNCDVFVSLFKTKTGKYTAEEFDVAHQTFQQTGKPLIYTYFRKASVSTSPSHRSDLLSLWDFQKKLDDLGHFRTEYESTDGLQRHFRDQLDKLRDGDLL